MATAVKGKNMCRTCRARSPTKIPDHARPRLNKPCQAEYLASQAARAEAAQNRPLKAAKTVHGATAVPAAAAAAAPATTAASVTVSPPVTVAPAAATAPLITSQVWNQVTEEGDNIGPRAGVFMFLFCVPRALAAFRKDSGPQGVDSMGKGVFDRVFHVQFNLSACLGHL